MDHRVSALTLPIVLTGLPGAGKTKVGRLLAEQLGVEHVDTDQLVEEHAGMTVAEIFSTRGEKAFRELEVQAVERAVGMSAVVSLGGGAITSPKVRSLLRDSSVVYIDVDHEELVRRTAHRDHRPLLREDPEATLARLRAEREPWYREVATVTVHSDAQPVSQVVEKIMTVMGGEYTSIRVYGPHPYDVIIGHRIPCSTITEVLRHDATRVLIIHAEAVGAHAQDIAEECTKRGLHVTCVSHPDGEQAKELSVVSQLWDEAARIHLGRSDAIIAVGGGATTDMAGFVAATWLRGIQLINVPTTLLAMVDAAIGGKTGINSAAGKNLIGAFHTPARVICDLQVLETLSDEDIRAGFGEIIKCGFIADPVILERVGAANPREIVDANGALIRELVRRAIAVKARVVSEDLRESGLREILNYGHTFAHAVERAENYEMKHGEAVAIGCVFAAHVALSFGLLTAEDIRQHEELFARVGLKVRYRGAGLDELVSIMYSDKKVRAGALRFVLLEGIANPIVRSVEAEQLHDAAEAMGLLKERS